MKLQVNGGELATAMALCGKVVVRRGLLPILECVHLRAIDGKLIISATDQSAWMTIELPATVEVDGECAVSQAFLASAVGSGDAKLKLVGGKLKVDGSAGKMSHPVHDGQEFPLLPPPPPKPWSVVRQASVLADMLLSTVPGCSGSSNEATLAFAGVALTAQGNDLVAVGCTNVSIFSYRVDGEAPPASLNQPMIPREVAKRWGDMLAARGDDTATLSVGGGFAALDVGNVRAGVSLLAEGAFGDVSEILMIRGAESVQFSGTEMAVAVHRCGEMDTRGYVGVLVEPGALSVIVRHGDVTADVPCESTGNGAAACLQFQASVLMPALKQAGASAYMTYGSQQGSPITLQRQDDSAWMAVVMPLNIAPPEDIISRLNA